MSNPDSSGGTPVDRRRFLALGVGAFVVASLPRALSARNRVVTRTVPVMGTIAELRVVHDDTALAERAIDAALDELYRVDRTMTRFSRHSEIGVANLEAARRPVALGAATAAVVERALHWADRTDGRFDPCIGEVCELWDVEHRRTPPPEGEVHRFAGLGLYRKLELDRRAGETIVYYHTPRLALDLGGIAKGWAVDRAVDALRAHGIRNALVNAGGDLYALGHSERGDAWEIGVQSPTDPNGIIARFPLTDRAAATSGDYRQYFEFHGRRYHHLMDPRTGAPRQTREHSVTVEAARCVDADAGATAIFGAARERAQQLLAGATPDARLVHSA
jgi:thiamine biosynthesis lipoprotein